MDNCLCLPNEYRFQWPEGSEWFAHSQYHHVQVYHLHRHSGWRVSNQARYHPFYITSSDRGGYLAKSTAEKQVPISHTRYQYVDTLPNPLLRDRYPFHIQGVNMY